MFGFRLQVKARKMADTGNRENGSRAAIEISVVG
jgi:hypothetical protein